MNKTIVLIDGENFLYKLEELTKTSKTPIDILKLNLSKLLSDIIKDKFNLKFDKIIYYVAKIGIFSQTEKKSKELISNQRKMKSRLEKQGIEYKYSGYVRAHEISKGKYGFREKGVDVGIAVDMVSYAFDKKYQNIILCSSDSDLQPAVREVRARNSKVIYLGFEHNPNKGLVYTTNSKILLKLEDIKKYKNE